MSDVTAIHKLVQKRNELKNEIAKIIVGQDVVVDQILLDGEYIGTSFRS